MALSSFQAVIGAEFGNLLVQGSDGVLRYLLGPATANQVPITNALGNLVFGPIPPATVPDPLTVTTLNATNATFTNATVTAALQLSGLGTGTIVSQIGLDGSNNVIIGTATITGVQVAMFYESPTSPSPAPGPNNPTVAGTNLIIGNLLFDSTGTPGGGLITVTNSQTLTVIVAGVYNLEWFGYVRWTGGGSGKAALVLLINGIPVNNGNTRPNYTPNTDMPNGQPCAGGELRRLAANDTIQLQLSSASGTNVQVFEVRLNATRTGA